MSQSIVVSEDDILWAANQLNGKVRAIFGDKFWEADLIAQGGALDTPSLGDTMHDYFQSRLEVDSSSITLGKILLGLVVGTLYRACGNELPLVTAAECLAVRSEFPLLRGRFVQAHLEVVVYDQMELLSPLFPHILARSILQNKIASQDRYFLFCCFHVILSAVLDEDSSAKTPPVLPAQSIQTRKAEAQPGEHSVFAPIVGTGVTFDDVAGCRQSKAAMVKLGNRITHPEALAQWGVPVPRGVLLYGPPGCGKTLMVKALATHTGRPLYSVKMSDIFTMWVWKSLENLKQLFQAAKSSEKGAIVFLDEADGFISSRKARDAYWQSKQLVDEFNVQMEDIKPTDKMLVVLATNIKEELDEAAVRDQRIDVVISVPPPTYEERLEVFGVHIARAARKAMQPIFNPQIDWAYAAQLTDGLSAAALASIVERSLWEKADLEAEGAHPAMVSTDDLVRSIRARLAEQSKSEKHMGFRQEQKS